MSTMTAPSWRTGRWSLVTGPRVRMVGIRTVRGAGVGEHERADHAVRTGPSPVLIICATVVLLGFVAALTALTYTGRDTAELTRVLDRVFTTLGAAGGVLGAGYAGKAWQESKTAAERLNGGFDTRVREVVHAALDERGAPGRTVESTDPELYGSLAVRPFLDTPHRCPDCSAASTSLRDGTGRYAIHHRASCQRHPGAQTLVL